MIGPFLKDKYSTSDWPLEFRMLCGKRWDGEKTTDRERRCPSGGCVCPYIISSSDVWAHVVVHGEAEGPTYDFTDRSLAMVWHYRE